MTAQGPRRPRGLIIAAPASGSGKTVITLGLLRHLAGRGRPVASFKVGPDYIDPAYHAAASGRDCLNLDLWAMRPATLARVLDRLAQANALVLGEGVMGLFDGAADGRGSTADVAAATGWPVVLVVDVRGQAGSVAALLRGFVSHRDDVTVAGVILNRCGGPAHANALQRALAPLGVPVLGVIPRRPELSLPSRHLGLLQAAEQPALESWLDQAAATVAAHLGIDALIDAARPAATPWPTGTPCAPGAPVPPPGQRIAVARDEAFAFAYPMVLEGWRRLGAVVGMFSPLADEAPADDAEAVYLPGGYPELHAGRLANNTRFLEGLRAAARRGASVYGECGGYMVLGRGLADAQGAGHAMAGLLPLETSFAERRLQLGYRRARLVADTPLGRVGACFAGHEFHYATITAAERARPLFSCRDAAGADLGTTGQADGRVFGSFLHLIDACDARDADDGGAADLRNGAAAGDERADRAAGRKHVGARPPTGGPEPVAFTLPGPLGAVA